MAMADNSHNFQASKRVVLMEKQLAALPVWWCEDGDEVLVPNPEEVQQWYLSQGTVFDMPKVKWVSSESVKVLQHSFVDPWGWNKSLWRKLPVLKDLPETTCERLDKIRSLSSREMAVKVLASFPIHAEITGQSFFCTTEHQIDEAISTCSQYVLKALWSSSGRGVMMLQSPDSTQSRQLCSSFLKHSGGLVIEPQYEKVQDFAMEFWSDGKGNVKFAGFSYFSVEYGRYSANWVAPQSVIISKIQARMEVLEMVKKHLESVLSKQIGNAYIGPLGVDMMIVKENESLKVHPCVEINLRRNMGWLAMHLIDRFVAPNVTARLISDYRQPGVIFQDHIQQKAPIFQDRRLVSGYLSLTPVFPDTQFRIYLQTDDCII